ncbi:MAG: transglutaminase-like domain-containing protein [Candidatus Obscuribacterales bacterium]|nr:transglutaminase-like domain-containing protein [Candidatus Obscuribacterales bacterium]
MGEGPGGAMSPDKQQTAKEPAEDSKRLRLVVFLMALLCVVASSCFVLTEWWLTATYLTLIVTGSLLSYFFRHKDPAWLRMVWWVGIILVGANGFREVNGPLRDEFDYVSPFVHFLSGIFCFITFSMRSRSDLNTASGLGLMLICLAAPVAKGLPYGACVLGYLVLGSIMMYYDCLSRTMNSWLKQPIVRAPEFRAPLRTRRIPRGNTLLLLTLVPLLAVAMFFYVPRADEAIDQIWAYTKVMNLEYLTDLIFKKTHTEPLKDKERTARSWFTKNDPNLIKQLPRKPEFEPAKRTRKEKEAEKKFKLSRAELRQLQIQLRQLKSELERAKQNDNKAEQEALEKKIAEIEKALKDKSKAKQKLPPPPPPPKVKKDDKPKPPEKKLEPPKPPEKKPEPPKPPKPPEVKVKPPVKKKEEKKPEVKPPEKKKEEKPKPPKPPEKKAEPPKKPKLPEKKAEPVKKAEPPKVKPPEKKAPPKPPPDPKIKAKPPGHKDPPKPPKPPEVKIDPKTLKLVPPKPPKDKPKPPEPPKKDKVKPPKPPEIKIDPKTLKLVPPKPTKDKPKPPEPPKKDKVKPPKPPEIKIDPKTLKLVPPKPTKDKPKPPEPPKKDKKDKVKPPKPPEIKIDPKTLKLVPPKPEKVKKPEKNKKPPKPEKKPPEIKIDPKTLKIEPPKPETKVKPPEKGKKPPKPPKSEKKPPEIKIDPKTLKLVPLTKAQLAEQERQRKLAEKKAEKNKKPAKPVIDPKKKPAVIKIDPKSLKLVPLTKAQIAEQERQRKLAEKKNSKKAKSLSEKKTEVKIDPKTLKLVPLTKAQLAEQERLRKLAGPPKYEPAGDVSDGNDLSIAPPIPLDDHVVLNVKSRRLVFLRRQCFDFYDGKSWSHSHEEGETVKVLDNTMPREPEKLEHVDTTIKSTRAGRLYTPAAPGSVGQGAQTSVLGNVTDQNPEPEPVEPQPVKVETAPAPEEVKASRPFEFESTMRPIFKVGLADALLRNKTLPTVELVQEVKVVAKSIGDVVPAGWIPQEVKLERTKVNVDALGVMTCDKPILRDTEFKVKTELPIYPIDTMKSDLPIDAQEEDQIRTRFNRFLQIPKTATDELFRTAEKISDPRCNWFVQCQQVAEYIRKNYEYDTNRECNPATTDEVQDFLFNRKKGNCTDYASAFVVLTRCIGIPARVVSGYSPGDANPVTGIQEVRLRHRLVWAEAYIPQFGWVPFDCTPQGVMPAVQRENSYTPEKLADDLEEKLGMAAAGIQLPSLTEIIGTVIGIIVALVLALVAYKVSTKLYRRWRERLDGRGPEWSLYKKVAKSVKQSTKLSRGSSETPTEFIERVQRVVNERRAAGKEAPDALPEALDGFLKSYSAVYFGQQLQEMESLRFHAFEVMKLSKSKIDLSDGGSNGSNGSNGPNGSNGGQKGRDIPKSDATSSALRRR